MMGVNLKNFLQYDAITRFSLFVSGIFILVLSLLFFDGIFRSHLLRINFYDIGQGDAIFIETPGRFQILVDGGPGPTILEKLPKDMPFYDRSIDLVIATHPDADHISGLIDVLERYDVNMVLFPRIGSNSLIYQRLLEEIANEGALIKEAKGIQKLQIDEMVSFNILNPLQGQVYKNDNDFSVVGLLKYEGFDLLLTSDIGKEREEELIALLPEKIEVLKVAHHGSKNSSSFSFLKRLSPQISVIQVGKNSYSHPSPQVLKNLTLVGSRIWRTDLNGDLRIFSDGKGYWIKR